MPRTMLQTAMLAEIAATQARADMQVNAVRALLAVGQDSTEAVQALFRELDHLILLREHLRSVEGLRDWPVAA